VAGSRLESPVVVRLMPATRYFRTPIRSLSVADKPHRKAGVAGSFVNEIEESMQVMGENYRFAKDADRASALGRFDEGRRVFG
jgi:hypothetical protein